MAETRKLTAEEFEKVKNSGKYTQEQLDKIKYMEIPVNVNRLSDEQLEDATGGMWHTDMGNSIVDGMYEKIDKILSDASRMSYISMQFPGDVIGLKQDGGQNHG